MWKRDGRWWCKFLCCSQRKQVEHSRTDSINPAVALLVGDVDYRKRQVINTHVRYMKTAFVLFARIHH